jgi:hypothetical protein
LPFVDLYLTLTTLPMSITAVQGTLIIARLRGTRVAVTAIGAASLLSGCYSYLPVPSAVARPGAEVRVLLTDAGSVAMAPLIGPRAITLDGVIDRTGGDSVVLRMRRVTNMGGEESAWAGERLAIPASTIASVRQKQLSGTRSALAAAVGAGVLTAVILASGSGGGGEPPVVVGPPPTGQ